jgi:hypothetical protein
MHVRTRWGLANALVASSILSNVLLVLPVFSSTDVQIRGWPAQNLDWQPFTVPQFGTRVDYPAGIFSVSDGKAETGFGQRGWRGWHVRKVPNPDPRVAIGQVMRPAHS